MLLSIKNINELDAAAQSIISFAPKNRIFLFNGQMGAGKTTFIKSLCKALGSDDNITSPTFSIVNEYKAAPDNIYHFDFYRLKTQTEALDLGFEEYLYSGNYCLIEWPEKIPDLLPSHYISIQIEVLNDDTRVFRIEQI